MAVRIQVAWSPQAGEAQEVELDLPAGSRVEDALQAAGVDAAQAAGLGIWGRPRDASHPLTDGDRVEVYRPLQLDPKEARRQRAAPRKAKGPRSGPPGSRGVARSAAPLVVKPGSAGIHDTLPETVVESRSDSTTPNGSR